MPGRADYRPANLASRRVLMKITYFRGYLIALATFAIAAPAVAVEFIERTAVALFNFFAPAFKDTRDLRVAYDGPAMLLDRAPLDPALQQSLRHEAGTRLRAIGRGG
jgi:hypothetical protein